MNTLKFTKLGLNFSLKRKIQNFSNKIFNELKKNKGKILTSFAISFLLLNLEKIHSKNKKVIKLILFLKTT